ncbi:DUF5958 family protein [Spirosoma gilvum]
MQLAKELRVVQFGQGVGVDAELVSQFQHLRQRDKTMLFYNLGGFLQDVSPTEADVDQVNDMQEQLGVDLPASDLKGHWSAIMRHILFMPGDNSDSLIILLLYLFRIAYQRQYALQRGKPDDWWYWDLSNPETVQAILVKHQTAIDEVYATPSFRMEFVTLAKLWYQSYGSPVVEDAEPEPVEGKEGRPIFLSYDEVVSTSIPHVVRQLSVGLSLLMNSLTKACSIKYRVRSEQARKIVLAVLEKYLAETYNCSPFSEGLF